MWAVWALWAGLWVAAVATPRQPIHFDKDSTLRRQMPHPFWQKRHQVNAAAARPPPDELRDFQQHLDAVNSQLMLRSPRGQRQYDVPQIECPLADDGMERFACPTPDRQGRYHCIDDHVLCDGFVDCPSGEDEDRQSCMFFKTTKAHLDVLADALLRWARGR
ncbi:uncharacterized protein LOC130452388 [Diorhabda sublineata]|uniref:uncharacterized protein LOC130452388 n=1 Tax=Diorhabda sublineata TaxID=1163346 RepID=UPI0024E11AF1|nr:uncharacterized protein LOC130452388 [Diorhabda sublineata]